jgi:hypothetical protein|uniref:43 kDa tail protein n=1 Tax=Siphoviridae sp. ctVqj4 TaxID=2826359 RepID=A0A8S5NK27_9CAUD|nr:MAG TPA: 43 kDa tail protein [Siphoviridae sp. ctVqj4]
MDYHLCIIKGKEIYDISDYAGSITWNDSIDTLGMQLSFSIGISMDRYQPALNIDPGDIVIFRNKVEIFRGIIVSKDIGRTENSFTAYDFCFYLNKSKVIKQYHKINAAVAIEQLCTELNIKVGSIAPMRCLITHIYYESTAAEIMDDILEQENQETGKQYLKEMRGDSFYIFERTSKPIIATFKPAFNIAEFNIGIAIGNPTRNLSIEEMKNSILIVSGNEKSVRILASAKDEEGISRYGLLQEIEKVDEKDKNKVRYIAQNKLSELNQVSETVSVELLGNDEVRAGRVLTLSEKMTGIEGSYLVKACNHTLSNGVHTMSVELGAV